MVIPAIISDFPSLFKSAATGVAPLNITFLEKSLKRYVLFMELLIYLIKNWPNALPIILNYMSIIYCELCQKYVEDDVKIDTDFDKHHDYECPNFECSISPNCPCEDCQKENVKMD